MIDTLIITVQTYGDKETSTTGEFSNLYSKLTWKIT